MTQTPDTHKPKWRQILTLVTFLIMAVLVYSLRKQIGSVIQDFGKINAFALLLIIPVEFLNYDAYARFLRKIYSILGEQVRYSTMFKFMLELNFVNHILPSGGVSGISYFNLRARSLGISSGKNTLTQFMKFFLLFLSFQPLLVLAVFLLAARGHTNNLILVTVTSLITLLIVGTAIMIYIIESRTRINGAMTFVTKVINRIIQIVRPKFPETIKVASVQRTFNELHDNYVELKSRWRDLKSPFFYMLMANVTEIAALYVVYIAFGEFVNVGAIILAYAIANFAGLISVLPAGIGVWEGLMTGVLVACGVPAELSIPVTIMYRVVNMFIQLTPGYFLYQKALKNGLSTS